MNTPPVPEQSLPWQDMIFTPPVEAAQAPSSVRTGPEIPLTADFQPHKNVGTNDRDPPKKSRAANLPAIRGYEVERVLGAGGMGVVYLARQTGLNRHVALKMILRGAQFDEEDQQRFLAEAQAVAQVQHPHIVQIHEVGEQDGVPFCALEYVAGGNLHDRISGQPQPPRDSAALLEQIARGVQAAHDQGIIHRDLKPANILLSFSRAPEARASLEEARACGARLNEETRACGARLSDFLPKITDFGLAKRLDGTSNLTQSGMIIGTPEFMAPEQAAGRNSEVNASADIYALGAILYNCLTGRPPFKGVSPMDTILQVVSEEPLHPGRLVPKLAPDLETICMKCLQKEAGKRYSSAQAFADDLQRFLKGEPILARPVGRLETAWRWCRRNPVVASLSALVVLLALTAIIGLSIGLSMVTGLNRDLTHANTKLQIKSDEAMTLATLGQEAVEGLSGADALDALGKAENVTPEQKALLRKAVQYYQQFVAATGRSPEPAEQLRQAKGYWQLGQLQDKLGEAAAAEDAYRHALDLYRNLYQAYPERTDYRAGYAEILHRRGQPLTQLGRLEESVQAYNAAVEQQEQLVHASPSHPAYRAVLARMLNDRGAALGRLDRSVDCLKDQRQAVALLEQAVKEQPGSEQFQHWLAMVRANLGTSLISVGRHGEALPLFQAALESWERLRQGKKGAVVYLDALAQLHNRMCKLHEDMGQRSAAIQHIDASVQIFEQLANAFPSVPGYRQLLAQSRANFVALLINVGRQSDALREVQKAQQDWERLVREYPDQPELVYNLAHTYYLCGRVSPRARARQAGDAASAYEQVQRLMQPLVRKHPEVSRYRAHLALGLNCLADERLLSGAVAEAHELHRDALTLWEGLAREHPKKPEYAISYGVCHLRLAGLARSQNRFEESLVWSSQALAIFHKLAAQNPHLKDVQIQLREAHSHLAQSYDSLGRHAEAAMYWDLTAALEKGAELATLRCRQAWSLARAGKHTAALAVVQQVPWKETQRDYQLDLVRVHAWAALTGPSDERDRAAARAMALLTELFRSKAPCLGGDNTLISLTTDPALNALRRRADFKQIFAKLPEGRLLIALYQDSAWPLLWGRPIP